VPYLESIRVFVRVVELGSITAGGRDLRLTPAVASNRIKELERRLGVRLLNRSTRKLTPTEVGQVFFDHARAVVDSLDGAEAVVAGFAGRPRGAIRVTAPLGIGRRVVAPLVPEFAEAYPEVEIRLRLSDRKVDILQDGLDVAFFVGEPQDSTLKLRKIADFARVLCAAPAYLARYGMPRTPEDLLKQRAQLSSPALPALAGILLGARNGRRSAEASRSPAALTPTTATYSPLGHSTAKASSTSRVSTCLRTSKREV
jgi:DNA-binding transcriptional LysR family regulator